MLPFLRAKSGSNKVTVAPQPLVVEVWLMLRRMLLLAVAVACGATGVALASPQFASTLTFTYSSKVPGSPSGFDSFATFNDPGDPAGSRKN